MAAPPLAGGETPVWMMMSKLPMMPTEESISGLNDAFYGLFGIPLSWALTIVFIQRQTKSRIHVE
ncbi:MAG: hypothetical protein H6661_13585 [Ardenticatenaceae bacterium]|nr:hypothetical protein [Ardenticatenaceae bacterium]